MIELVEKTPDELKQFQLGFGSYLMVKPFSSRRGVDGEKFQPMLDGIASIDIAEFVDDAPADLAAYGLDRPWGELLVRDKAGTLHLLFGADRGSDKVCFQVAGERAVYAVDKYKLDFLNTKAFDLIDRFVFIPNIDDVDRLDVTADGATHTFTLARVTKKAAEAGAEDEVLTTYTGDGRELNEDWFKKFYQSVIALSVEGEASRTVSNAPVITIRFRLNKGEKRDVTVGLAPYDKVFYASFVDGVGGFALTRVQAEGMLAKMRTLLAGEEGVSRLAQLVRTYFRCDGHHVQFNVVSRETLEAAKADPESHRGLIVRVAGYSDYFCDLSDALKDEIIARTEQVDL